MEVTLCSRDEVPLWLSESLPGTLPTPLCDIPVGLWQCVRPEVW